MSNQKRIKAVRPTGESPFWQHRHFSKWLVFLFAFILFANAITGGYNMDDELVTMNHRLTSKGISAIPEIFSSPYYEDNQGYAYEYRPVVLISFAIEHQFWGDNPGVSHFFNTALYALCCLVLFHLLLKLFPGGSSYIPLAITLLFITHPTHTEVVCSIKNRDEIFALLFGLLTMLVAFKIVVESRKWMYATLPVLFVLALMSKTTAISFAILVPVALIFLTKASFRNILTITILLQLPGYFLLNLGTGFEKILVPFGITGIVSAFYVLVNFQESLHLTKRLFNAVNSSFFQNDTSEYSVKSDPKQDNYFAEFLRSVIPERPLFALVPIFAAVVPSVLYLWLVKNGYSSFGLIPLVALLVLAWKGEYRISWWAKVCIGFVLCINLYPIAKSRALFNNIELDFLYALAITIYLTFQLIFGKRSLVMPILLSFALISFIRYTLTFNDNGIPINWNLFAVPLLLLSVNRYVRYLLTFVLLIHIGQTLFQPLVGGSKTELLSYFVYLIYLVVIEFKKGVNIFSWGCIVIAIVIFHTNQIQIDKTLSKPNLTGKIIETTNQINPHIIVKQDRPLHYTEVTIDPGDPVSIKLGTSMEILFHYLKKTILPYPLAYYYGYKFIKPMKITDTVPLISLLIHLALFAIALYLMHKDPLISFGLFVYLFSIATFSNYMQYIPGMVADRYLLVPTLGWSIVLVGVLRKFSGVADNAKDINWAAIKPAAKYPFLAIFVLYSTLTFSRNFDWKDKLTLFRHDIEYVNKSSQAHNLLALHLMNQSTQETDPVKQKQLTDEALSHFKKAQEIYPAFFNVAYDIGRVYSILNMTDSAISAFKHALTLDSTLPDIYQRMGDLYLSKGNYNESNYFFQKYITKEPADYTGYGKLSRNYFEQKLFNESIKVNKAAAQNIPGTIDPYINIAYTFLQIQNTDSALFYLLIADKLQPNNPQVQSSIQQLTNIGKNSKLP